MKQQDLVVGPLVDPVSITKKAVQGDERRKHGRFAVSASAEMLEVRTRTRLAGRASDLGPGGCYIDTVTPFPVGTSLMLNLISENRNVQAKVNVVYAKTGMGMGLAFAEMTAKQKENLAAWLHELNGERAQPQAPEVSRPYVQQVTIEEPIVPVEGTGLLGVVEDLISLLRVKRILSESEVELLREKLSK